METRKIIADYYCGVDLHAKKNYICVLNKDGDIMLKHNIKNNFQSFKQNIQQFLPNLAIGCESTYNYYWLADGCHNEGLRFHLGHALYMKAISGHKKKNDPLDAETIANLLRTSFFPEAFPYPEKMRATRDLLRRRHRLVRLRGEAYAHIQLVCHQYAITDVGGADVRNKDARQLLLDRFLTDDVRNNIATDVQLIELFDPIIAQLEQKIIKQAKHHNYRDYALLLSTPGIGTMIALIILYEIHNIKRFKTVQKFSSYCRVVKCERSSAGKRTGSKNQKIGNPYLKWAMSEIIINAQTNEEIKKYADKLESKYGRRRARAQIAHKFAVAIYFMLKNSQPFDLERFLK
jgi:transposase